MAISLPVSAAEVKVEAINELLPFYDASIRTVREPKPNDEFPPMRTLLSRSRYWVQDGHLDVVIQLNESALARELGDVILKMQIGELDGTEPLSEFSFKPPAYAMIAYPDIPEGLLPAGQGELRILLEDKNGRELAQAKHGFRVETSALEKPINGSIALTILNEEAVTLDDLPVTAGVPFPRGLIYDTSHLRLVATDRPGRPEIPIQVKTVGRWAKWESVKWAHISFMVDLGGEARRLELEYGPKVNCEELPPMEASVEGNNPLVDAGKLKLQNGLWYRSSDNADYVEIVNKHGMDGAFVQPSGKAVYHSSNGGEWEIEETGPLKTVLKKSGWYTEDSTEDAYCKYIVRYFLYEDSPLVKIFYSWIFTGDGNKDKIANMGWELAMSEGYEPLGVLPSYDSEFIGEKGDYLLQWDYEHFDFNKDGVIGEYPGARAPGVAAVKVKQDINLFLGIRDFWQNYPSELEFTKGSLWFHNWPRHNRPAGYTFEGVLEPEAGEAAFPSASRHGQYQDGYLTRSEWTLNLIQARFAHEGEKLNFHLPYEVTVDPVHSRMRAGRPWNKYWRKGEPDSINAQGISRTEEMWLLAQSGDKDVDNAVRVLKGLNEETLRAVVDPEWVASSGVFYEIRQKDTENFPDEERAYESIAMAPAQWREHLGIYGMWIYGDIPGWDLGLKRREPALYRAYRKRHHGWPYSWIPYARSGDSKLLHEADIATRQNIDANWKHYGTGDIKRGVIHRSTLPWASTIGEDENATRTRDYESKVDYLLYAWYLNDYWRAWDLFQEWVALTKVEDAGKLRGPIAIRGPFGEGSLDMRFPLTMLKSYVETYEATFDPWFLVAAHELARGFERELLEEGTLGTPYVTAFREYQRFTGSDDWEQYYLTYADFTGGIDYVQYIDPMIEPNAYAWRLTGDDYYLGRLADILEWTKASVWTGEQPGYLEGYYIHRSDHETPQTTGWMLQYFPLALDALYRSEKNVVPVANRLMLLEQNPRVIFLHDGSGDIPLVLKETLGGKGKARAVPYSLVGPSGDIILQGEWATDKPLELSLPKNSEVGEYCLQLTNSRSLAVPVCQRSEVPEVIVTEPGEGINLLGYHDQVWFRVPEGIDEFTMELPLAKGSEVRRLSIWGPDGELVWDKSIYMDTYDGPNPISLTVPVGPGQAGRLWRITTPGAQLNFSPDKRIPPVYSNDRGRWFLPARM